MRSDRVGNAPILSDIQMKKKERGEHFHIFDKNVGAHLVRWNDNNVVNCLSNCIGLLPLEPVERFSRKESKKISILRPQIMKVYNQFS